MERIDTNSFLTFLYDVDYMFILYKHDLAVRAISFRHYHLLNFNQEQVDIVRESFKIPADEEIHLGRTVHRQFIKFSPSAWPLVVKPTNSEPPEITVRVAPKASETAAREAVGSSSVESMEPSQPPSGARQAPRTRPQRAAPADQQIPRPTRGNTVLLYQCNC